MGENKIIVTPIALRNQKPTDIKECYVELKDNHLIYKTEFWADEPIIADDPESGWEQVFNSYEWTVMKRNVAGLEKSFTKDKKWGVYIAISGFEYDLKTYYRTQAAAQEFYDKIHQWLLK
jgi:hypothetical protein